MIQPKKHTPSTPATGHPNPTCCRTRRHLSLGLRRCKGKRNNGAPIPQPKTDNTTWWAFRSSCSSTGCVATGTELDKINHQVASTPAATDILHFADNHWQDSTPLQDQVPMQRCLGANREVTAGEETEMVAWSLEPQPDGTLKGVVTRHRLTNECGCQGTGCPVPLCWQRGWAMCRPVSPWPIRRQLLLPRRPASRPESLGVRYSTAPIAWTSTMHNQTVNGAPSIQAPLTNRTDWWAFRSLCTSTGCVATGSQLADTNHQEAVGVAVVLHFVDGHWQDTPYLQPPTSAVPRNKWHSHFH